MWFMFIERKPVKKNLFKYVCNSCGMKVYAKAEKSIMCGNCNVELEMEQVEEESESEES